MAKSGGARRTSDPDIRLIAEDRRIRRYFHLTGLFRLVAFVYLQGTPDEATSSSFARLDTAAITSGNHCLAGR